MVLDLEQAASLSAEVSSPAPAAGVIRADLNCPGSTCVPRFQNPCAAKKPWKACETRPGVWIAAKCPELISRYSA